MSCAFLTRLKMVVVLRFYSFIHGAETYHNSVIADIPYLE